MNKVNVVIHVIPDHVQLDTLIGFSEEYDGRIFSSRSEIKINRTKDGYSVLFRDSDYNNLDCKTFITTLIKLFRDNLPDTLIVASLVYNHMTLCDDHGDEETINKMALMTEIMHAISVDPRFKFKFDTCTGIQLSDETEDDVDMFTDDFDDDEDDPEDIDIMDMFTNPYLKKDEDLLKVVKKKYKPSNVVKNSKNGKRDYHRHGLMISSKKDIEKDRKILKKFLKEFIPGKSTWKKDFRADVLKRWMSMYSISKSELANRQKQIRKESLKKSRNKNVVNAINASRKLLTVPVSDWYNPNK